MNQRLPPAKLAEFASKSDREAKDMPSTAVPLHYTRTGIRHFSVISHFSVLVLALFLSLPSKSVAQLPDAAGHIGTIVINNNDQFTTSLWVTLRINAVDDGNGVLQMQFSNDGDNWTAPEPYQTTRSWGLLDGGYPPQMNTVLKTVYVRFQDGLGNWSKAVTDSIVLARTALDVPQIEELWIAQQAPTNYDGTQPPGSALNPFLVPPPPNELQFDGLMYTLFTNYLRYWPEAYGTTNFPPPATNMTVLTVHIGAGVYETHGDNAAHGVQLAWRPSHGWRIFGAGKDVTTLKAVDLRYGYTYRVNVIGGAGEYDNLEIADLTLDANIHEGGPVMNGQFSQGMCFCGSNVQIRRVKVKNSGSHLPGAEPAAVNLQNWSVQNDDWNLIMEDCEIVHPQYGNAYNPNMIVISGTWAADGSVRYFHNTIIRNCYIDGTAYDGDVPINQALYPWTERGNATFGCGGTWGARIEDNLVVNTARGFYVDSPTLHDITLRNNHFRNVFIGADISLYSNPAHTQRLEDTFTFVNNLVEFDPHYYTFGETWGTYGWRLAFIMTGNIRSLVDYTFHHLVLSNNVFQFTDQTTPDSNVEGLAGQLQSVRQAEVQNNVFLGMPHPLAWDNAPQYLERQADIVDPAQPVPLLYQNNTLGDGTVSEAYPYILDKTLPQPVVVQGDLVRVPAPNVGDLPATIADGLPPGYSLQPGGFLQWQTGTHDVGRYLVSFYDSTNRLRDPRRMIVTVLNQVPESDPHALASGLMAFWRFGESAGTQLADSSGNGIDIDAAWAINTGLLTRGAPGYRVGQRAVHFNPRTPASASPFLIPNTNRRLFDGYPVMYHPILQGPTTLYRPLTISFWVKADAEPPGQQCIFNQAGGNSWFFASVFPGTNTTDQKIGLVFSTLDQNLTVATDAIYPVAAWHQVTLVYDGVSARVYVDGTVAAQQLCGQLPGFAADKTLFFGGGPGGDLFLGSLADFMIWNRPLSPGEVTQLYHQQTTGSTPSLVPAAPCGLSAQAISSTSVALSWRDNSMNESSFVVERAADGVNFTQLAVLAANSVAYTDSVPVAEGIYYYRVKAVNASGNSDYSNLAVAGTSTPTPAGTASFGSAADLGSFTVSAPVGTAWIAVANQHWIHTASSGVGLGTIDFNIDSNPSTAPRAGTITASSGTYLVLQDGARNLNVVSANLPTGVAVTLSPSDNSGNSSGMTLITRTYNTNDSVVLTAPSTAAGFAFQKWQQDGQDLTTSPTVTVLIQSNHTLAAVYRPAASYGFAMAPLSFSTNGGSGTYAIDVTLSSSTWSVANVPSWLHLSCLSGTGSYTGSFTVDANSGPPRTGPVTLLGETSRLSSGLSQGGAWWPLWWQNSAGCVALWSVQGTNSLGASRVNMTPVAPGWNVVGTADFSGTGFSDIVWQSTDGWVALWLMNGTNCVRTVRLNNVPVAPGWKVVGTGDFTGNGQNDILWQSTGGWVAIWLMNGTNFLQSVRVNSTPIDSSWKIVGTGDFDGDGQTDILWQSTTAGWIAVWFMNGTTMARSARISYQPPNLGWQIVGTTDVDGDGQVDILWRSNSGFLGYWLMERTAFSKSGRLNPAWADPSWRVVGPR
jgi:hypothetical protein